MTDKQVEEEETMVDRVNDFLTDSNHSDDDCELVFTLYGIILNLANENAVLTMENSLLEREIRIAENAILRMEKEAKEPKYLA